ncbi:predicted protein [Chaetomium globosum CBS 148.51]|uniref:Uncharacterized protein n=1 Tax=Chaetomium globosum (strain ATCC 6205 / CBS 148.51 / DSM 1962 / NBRC 6347 / NRRL 1970) TaxID=306901 RepID=Q2HG35_CHAGB|nr:uncharacterized protein CHGG_00819 [Chaetomium globosum CBS 148.51]EAQ92584.1 predicted protein [Chaetomium globosum CBS 148.51]
MHPVHAAEQQTAHQPAHELPKSAPPGPESCINNVGQPPEDHSKTTTRQGADACLHAGDATGSGLLMLPETTQTTTPFPHPNLLPARDICTPMNNHCTNPCYAEDDAGSVLHTIHRCSAAHRSDGAAGAAQHAHAMPCMYPFGDSWCGCTHGLTGQHTAYERVLTYAGETVRVEGIWRTLGGQRRDRRAEWRGRARAVSNKRVVPIWTNEIESQLQNMVVIQNNMKRSWR